MSVAITIVLLLLPLIVPPPTVILPLLLTLNLLTAPTCKSISNDAAADVVSVALNFMPVNVTATLFHVWAKFRTGASAVSVAPVSDVDPSSVVATVCVE